MASEVNTDFNPAFGSVMDRLRAQAAARGITTHYISGVRSLDDQKQLYANYLAGRAGRPLPYPARGSVSLAAVPGTSLHERGFAADLVADDPSRQAELRSLGNQVGLRTLGQSDPNHFELPAAAIAKAGGGGGTATAYAPSPPVAPAVAAINAAAAPPGTTISASRAPVAGALSKPAAAAGGGFMTSVANIESNDRNIYSGVDKDYAGQPNSRSQGHWQIDTPTWKQFGAQAGIDLTQYPNAMSAPRDVQEQVARLIPLSRFGGRTQKLLTKQYGTLDKSQTLGALDAKYGGTDGTAPGATAVASSTGDSALAPAGTSGTAPAAPQPWYASLTKKPEGGGKSPLESAVAAFTQGPERMKQAEEDQAPQQVKNEAGPAPAARNVSPGLANVQQTYGQTLNSFMQPLTWTSAPPQAPQTPAAGLQAQAAPSVPGISLNSLLTPSQGIGYGIPAVGFGYG